MTGFQRVLDGRYLTPTTVPVRRVAVVTAVDTAAGVATVTVGGDPTDDPGVPYLASYLPAVGDVAQMDLVAGAPVLLGRVGGPTPPLGVIGFATPLTSGVGPTSGTTELDVITAPAVTPAGTNRRLRITFHARAYTCTLATDLFVVKIKEGATVLAEAHYNPDDTGAVSIGTDFTAWVSSPTAVAHTYKATIVRAIGTGTASVSATATAPITLAVEDVGNV